MLESPATDPGRAAEEMQDPTKLPLPGGYYLCQLQPDHRTCSLHMPDGLHIGNMLSEHAADFADVLKAAEAEAAQLRAHLHGAEKGAEAMRDALDQAEACLSIVAPRSDKAEYLRTLSVVRAALAAKSAPPLNRSETDGGRS